MPSRGTAAVCQKSMPAVSDAFSSRVIPSTSAAMSRPGPVRGRNCSMSVASPLLRGRRGGRLGLLLPLALLAPGRLGDQLHLDLAVDHLDHDGVAGAVLEPEQLLGERILDHLLDEPAERPGAVDLAQAPTD